MTHLLTHHELWHAHQYKCAISPQDALDYQYQYNFENLLPELGQEAYETQIVEVETRAFAAQLKDRLSLLKGGRSNDLIIKCFILEKSVTEVVAKVLAKPLLKYDDIKNEFLYWLENRNYDCPNQIGINGYTAVPVAKITLHLDATGVYGFMIALRNNLIKTKEYVDKDFPRK